MGISASVVNNARDILNRDMTNIFRAQLLIASQNTYFEGRKLTRKVQKGRATILNKYPDLYAHLASRPYSISQTQSGCYVTMDVMKRLRFLDMKKLGNLRIYNRQVWGIIYNNSFSDIRRGVSNEVYDQLTDKLKRALGE